jgi:hypothetical protein
MNSITHHVAVDVSQNTACFDIILSVKATKVIQYVAESENNVSMKADHLSRSTALLLSRIPAWLYGRLMDEAERSHVGSSRLVGSALEAYLLFGDIQPDEQARSSSRVEERNDEE